MIMFVVVNNLLFSFVFFCLYKKSYAYICFMLMFLMNYIDAVWIKSDEMVNER